MLEGVELVQGIFLLHPVQRAPQVGGCDLCVSTGHRLQDGVVDEHELILCGETIIKHNNIIFVIITISLLGVIVDPCCE